MAKKLYDYCINKPYFFNASNVDRITVKKIAVIYAFEEDENIDEVMDAVDEVIKMVIEGK